MFLELCLQFSDAYVSYYFSNHKKQKKSYLHVSSGTIFYEKVRHQIVVTLLQELLIPKTKLREK